MNPLLAFGAAAIGGKALYDYATTSAHDRVLKRTYKTVRRQADEDATVYVDHIDVTEDTPAGVVTNVNGVPDLVLNQPRGTKLIVEVETGDSLKDSAGHVVDQLEDFATPGFRRVLVVPSGATDTASKLLKENDLDAVTVATSGGIEALV